MCGKTSEMLMTPVVYNSNVWISNTSMMFLKFWPAYIGNGAQKVIL